MKDFIKWLGLTVLLTVVLIGGTGAAVYTVKKISEYPRTYTANNVDRFIIERGNQYFNIGYSELKTNITHGATWTGTNANFTNIVASNVTVQVNVVNTNYSTNTFIDTLIATNATFGDINATNVQLTTIYGDTNYLTNVFIDTLNVTNGTFGDISATNVNIVTLNSDTNYLTNGYLELLTANTAYITNLNFNEGFGDTLTVTNLTIGTETVTRIQITGNSYYGIGGWPGPTNTVDVSRYNYWLYTNASDTEITGWTNAAPASSNSFEFAVMFFTNGAGSNVTIRIPSDWVTIDGNKSWTLTNGTRGALSASKSPLWSTAAFSWFTTSNMPVAGLFDNLTVTNGLTNTAIANAPFLKADANGKLTPTYDGWALTNLNATNMSGTVDYAEFATNLIGYTFPANTTAGVLTNDGAGNLSWQPIQTFIENTTWNIMNVSNINSTTNYTEFLTVNNYTILSNAAIKGGLTVNNVTITNSLAFTTNAWAGPTNVINAQLARVRYHSYTPCSITGITNTPTFTVGGVLLTIKNLASSNITVTLNGGFAGGTRSHTITNGMWAKFSIEYDPSGPETNYVFRHF